MTDIMKLATAYATSAQVDGRHDFDSSKTAKARAALQAAIEALQAECAEHKENAIRNARIAVSIRAERDQLQAENDLLKGYRDRALELATAYNNAQENIEQINAHREHILAVNEKLTAQVDAMGKGEPDGNALLQAIARGWCSEKNSGKVMDALLALAIRDEVQKLYAAPKALEPLTDDAIWKNDALMSANSGYGATFETLREIIRAIEAAHGITKGTP